MYIKYFINRKENKFMLICELLYIVCIALLEKSSNREYIVKPPTREQALCRPIDKTCIIELVLLKFCYNYNSNFGLLNLNRNNKIVSKYKASE